MCVSSYELEFSFCEGQVGGGGCCQSGKNSGIPIFFGLRKLLKIAKIMIALYNLEIKIFFAALPWNRAFPVSNLILNDDSIIYCLVCSCCHGKLISLFSVQSAVITLLVKNKIYQTSRLAVQHLTRGANHSLFDFFL